MDSSHALTPVGVGDEPSPAILILGATGFIGQELARQLLASGHRIRILVRNLGRLPDDIQGPGMEVTDRRSDAP